MGFGGGGALGGAMGNGGRRRLRWGAELKVGGDGEWEGGRSLTWGAELKEGGDGELGWAELKVRGGA